MALSLGVLTAQLRTDATHFNSGLLQAQHSLSAFGSAAMRVTAVVGAMAGGAGLAGVGLQAVRMAADMEQAQIAFTTMLGSAQKADQFLRDLFQFAARTPFEFVGLQSQARQLLAYGFTAEKILPTLEAVGNATSALGLGQEGIQRITLALGQMLAKGKVSAEEIRQLAEAGIPAWKMLADSIGVTIPQAMKMAEQNAIPGLQAVNVLVAGMNRAFPNMMEKQAKTIIGLWSTVKDNVGGIMRVLGKEITEALNLRPVLQTAIDSLQMWAAVVESQGIAGAAKRLFGPEVRLAIYGVAGAISFILIPTMIALGKAITATLMRAGPIVALGALFGIVVGEMSERWFVFAEQYGGTTQAMSLVWARFTGGLRVVWRGLIDGMLDAWAGLKITWHETLAGMSAGMARMFSYFLPGVAAGLDEWAQKQRAIADQERGMIQDREAARSLLMAQISDEVGGLQARLQAQGKADDLYASEARWLEHIRKSQEGLEAPITANADAMRAWDDAAAKLKASITGASEAAKKIPDIVVSNTGLQILQAQYEEARAMGRPAAAAQALAGMEAAQALATQEAGTLRSFGVGVTPRAGGGLVTRPEIALLGERGPELVLNQAQMAQMGGTIEHTGVIRVEGVNGQGDLVAVTSIVMERVAEAVRTDQARYGGYQSAYKRFR